MGATNESLYNHAGHHICSPVRDQDNIFYLHGWLQFVNLIFHPYGAKLEDPLMMIPNHLIVLWEG